MKEPYPNREKIPGWDFFCLNFATENKPEVATFLFINLKVSLT